MNQLFEICKDVSELSAIQTLIFTGHLRPYLTKSQAFRMFGRKRVEEWVNKKAISFHKDGDHSAVWRIDRMAIELHARSLKLNRMLTGIDHLSFF